ncbi:uncharacterized protein LOC123526437 [Mercenaria mercenaria]|uniref:uncharacterized protein LOC123526437 n=1 Tax=Mercenaria mercenaria TaxID=6596 RepID=UPI00234FAA94|nr:uncharacterized protein LOC123526437 [Mercenaria mercenaria]
MGGKMSLFFQLLLIFSLLHCASAMRNVKVSSGSAILSPSTTDDFAKQLDLKIGERNEKLTMRKKNLPAISKPPSRRSTAKIELLQSEDGSTTCIDNCESGSCTTRCIKQEENAVTYVTERRTLTIENDIPPQFPSAGVLKKMRESIQSKMERETRHRRTATENGAINRRAAPEGKKPKLLVPNIETDTAIIKIRVMIDVAFLERFVVFVGGDIQAAIDEIECFFVLTMNQVALYYANLKELGASITSSDGVNYPVDFLPYLESVELPPKNESDGTYYDITAIVNNRDEGGNLITNIFDSGDNNIFFDVGGLVIDFGLYQYGLTQGLQQPYDLLHFVTGDKLVVDFYIIEGNVTSFDRREELGGIAYIGAFCNDFASTGFDGRNGFSAFQYPVIDRIIAHEIGHNIGCFHDVTEICPAEKLNVMSPLPVPKLESLPDYYKWSVCSGEDIANYFAFLNLTSVELATCLYTNKPTEEEFLANFCEGLLGTKYDINDQCRLFFGNDSYVCTNGSNVLETGYVEADKCQTKSGPGGIFDPLPLLSCAKDGSCDDTPYFLDHIFDGTKCANKGGDPAGNQVCYHGICETNLKICSKSQGKGQNTKK